jgi:hypothetical protein
MYKHITLKLTMAVSPLSFQSAHFMNISFYVFHNITHLPLFQLPSVKEELKKPAPVHVAHRHCLY